MSLVLWNPQAVTVTRHAATETSDGAGGFVDNAPATIFTGVADVIISNRVNEVRSEAPAGIDTQKIRQFQFLNPVDFNGEVTYFKAQDRIAYDGEVPGEIYTVQFVWVFPDVITVEAWVMQ
jgi:hypothetical protein